MDNVRGIQGINPPELSTPSIRRIDRTQAVEPIQDRIDISPAAAKVAEVEAYSELAKVAPDIREDVVERAQAKVASGEYFKPEVTESVARKIADSLI